jgi:hypothetical protein
LRRGENKTHRTRTHYHPRQQSPPAATRAKAPPIPQPENTRYRSVPEAMVSPAIPQIQLTVPSNGYLEPFPTIHNMNKIAGRIRETTFGKIYAVPGANVKTPTKPPPEALSYDQDYLIAYSLHLLNVVAFSMAYETTVQYRATTGNRRNCRWFAVQPHSLPHVINGYYTASSMMHAVTRERIPNGSD